MSATTIFPCLDALHLLKHPFYQDWMAGRLTRDQLKDYARQYYAHVAAFPRYLSAVHSACENAAIRKELLENLNDEEGTGTQVSHPELWLRFAEGVGAPREETQATAPRAGVQNVTDTFFRQARSSFHEGLGALYAYESQVPEIAESKITGLQTQYGVNDERTLQFFEVHKAADVYHRESIRAIIESLSDREKAEAEQAAKEAATALWDFLSEIHEGPARATA